MRPALANTRWKLIDRSTGAEGGPPPVPTGVQGCTAGQGRLTLHRRDPKVELVAVAQVDDPRRLRRG
jgi:hypothetical protein